MKKTLSIFLALTMLLTLLSGMSFSALAVTSGDYEYNELENGEIEISAYNGSAIDLYIPSQHDGKTVTAIADMAFFQNSTITEFHLPSTVKTIGMAAFFECSMEVIDLPDSLETIGDNAFMNCSVLKEISLGKNVSGINTDTFNGCTRVSSYSVSEDNNSYSSAGGVMFNKDKTALLYYPVASENESYTAPEGLEKISVNSFNSAKSLKEISLPVSVKTIEDDAFASCDKLTDVFYESNEDDWAKVSVSTSGNDYFLNAQMHFNSKPEPEPCQTHTKKDGDGGTVTKEATCTEKGERVFECAVCGETFSEEISPIGHTAVAIKAVAPTYFEKGKTEGKRCSVCGVILTPQKAVAKLVLAVPSKKKATAKKKAFVFSWKQNKNASGYIIEYSTSKKFTKKTTGRITVKKNSTVKKTVKKLKSKKTYYIRIRAYKKSGAKTAYSKWAKTVKVKTK